MDDSTLDSVYNQIVRVNDTAGGVRPGNIAQLLGLTASETQEAFDKLAQAKRIEQFKDSDHRREYWRPRAR